jgi:hypothetical protein
MPKKSELPSRVRQEIRNDYRGDIEARLRLFKCFCVRLIVPHESSYLSALEAMEERALGPEGHAEQHVAIGLQTVDPTTTTGMSPKPPCDITARSLDQAINEPGSNPAARVINTCLMWARFNAKFFCEDMEDGWREMEALIGNALERILEAPTLEDAAAECRKPVRIASDCVVH